MQSANINECRCWSTFHVSKLLIAVLFSAVLVTLSPAAPIVIVPKTRIQKRSDKGAKTVLPASLSTTTVTNTNDNGAGSLRQAIADAAPGGTIGFDTNVFATPQTITLTSGQLVIDKNLTIQGPGANILSVSGNNSSRVFFISGGVSATLDEITIKEGYELGNGGGGIYNSGTLTVSNSSIHNNYVYSLCGGKSAGGGAFNDGTLTVNRSSIYSNFAICGDGGYPYSLAEGGGVFSSGALTINDSTISGNGVSSDSESWSSGAMGGGIFVSGVMTLINTTLYGNGANAQGDRGASFGVGIYTTSYSILTNTIVVGNLDNCTNPCEDDIYGTINNASHDLIGDQFSSGGIQNGVNGNIVGVNPLLGPLKNNGGATMTRALLPGSPAINTGDSCVLTENGCGFSHPALTTDQRGRPRNDTVDIGAFERQALEPSLTTLFDFDGDGKSDVSVFRPSDSVWYLNRSTDGFAAAQFGLATDHIVPKDYDGDGKTDIAVFRDGVWYWISSSNNQFNAVQFGQAGDIPVPADYTGDGRAELAVYRGGQWWSLDLSNGQTSVLNFGLPTDKPVVADYDGDGKADQAVYRNGEWHLDLSTTGYHVVQFGLPTDQPLVGDFDGDGKADEAVYRDGVWYVLQSSHGFAAFQFGLASDVPVPADYDGDGKTDAAVFRNGTWWIYQSSSGSVSVTNFGLPEDMPVPSAYSR